MTPVHHAFTSLVPITGATELSARLDALGADVDHEPTFRFWEVPGLHFARVAVLPGRGGPSRLLISAVGDRAAVPLFDRWWELAQATLPGLLGPHVDGDLEARLRAGLLRPPETFFEGFPHQDRAAVEADEDLYRRARALLVPGENAVDAHRRIAAALAPTPPVAGPSLLRRAIAAARALPRTLPRAPANRIGVQVVASILFSTIDSALEAMRLPRAGNPALRRAERAERHVPSPRPDPRHLRRLLAAEDHQVQNGFTFYGPVKPSRFRRLRLRWALAMSDWFARHWYVDGRLSGVGTIHFARIHAVDGGESMLFQSDYDGSWEAYLADFVTVGRFAVVNSWNNLLGCPPTWDGQPEPGFANAFLPYIRCYQVRNNLWYSAYRALTVAEIRRNLRVRALLCRPAGRRRSRELQRLLT